MHRDGRIQQPEQAQHTLALRGVSPREHLKNPRNAGGRADAIEDAIDLLDVLEEQLALGTHEAADAREDPREVIEAPPVEERVRDALECDEDALMQRRLRDEADLEEDLDELLEGPRPGAQDDAAEAFEVVLVHRKR